MTDASSVRKPSGALTRGIVIGLTLLTVFGQPLVGKSAETSLPVAVRLTTELAVNPLAVDASPPRFSWQMVSVAGRRGQQQSAYRLLVATDPACLREGRADVWDSQRVPSDECLLVPLDKIKLQPKTRYYWTVKLWDENNQAGNYAPAARFETGLFNLNEWHEGGVDWIESPLGPAVDEDFDAWAKFATLQLGPRNKAGVIVPAAAEGPAPADFAAARKHYYELLRDGVWSGVRMRREFDVGSIRRARLYICGLGYYRAYLNGRKIGDRDLAPSDSHFFAHAYYQVFDVGDLLKAGRNCLAVELVNGRWRAWPGNTAEIYHDRPILLARLEITDNSGKTTLIGSDSQWQCGPSPLRRSSFWVGEVRDDRREQAGWQQAGFTTKDWVPARVAPVGRKIPELDIDPMPPEKMTAEQPPIRRSEPKPGVYVYDFGRMIGGRARFVFHGLKRGQQVVVRYAEAIDDRPYDAPYALAYYDTFANTQQEPGMLKFKRRGSVAAEGMLAYTNRAGEAVKWRLPGGVYAYTDMFVSAGKPEEEWTPNFTYTGFRYLEILGLSQPLPMTDVAAYDLRTHPEIIGSLTTDNAKLSRVLKGVQDTVLACFHSQLQDNNGAERNPNALNLALNDLNLAYWMNVYPLWCKGAADTVKMDALLNCPANMICGMRDLSLKQSRKINISNCLHYGCLPWDLYAFYRDARAAKSLLPWSVAFVRETSEHTVWETDYGSADHIATSSLKGLPSRGWVKNDRLTDPQFFKCACILRVARLAEDVAGQLSRPAEADELQQLVSRFAPQVVKAYYHPDKAAWTPDYPTIQGRDLTLMFGRLEPRRSDRELCAEIVQEIHQVTGGHQITGSRLSYPLLHALSQNGFSDEALRLLLREDYPSLLEMIRQTGNTIRESWGTLDSFAQIEGLTEMGKWFYADLVGIEPSLRHPGFAAFSLAPRVPAGIKHYHFNYDSPRGVIASDWQETGPSVRWQILVPPNAVATISIPAAPTETVNEGRGLAAEQPGVTSLPPRDGRQRFKIVSGNYEFTFPRAAP
jgi:alpha-L-rhamnosidase